MYYYSLLKYQEFFASFASTETRQYAQDATTQAVQIQVAILAKRIHHIDWYKIISCSIRFMAMNCFVKNVIVQPIIFKIVMMFKLQFFYDTFLTIQ